MGLLSWGCRTACVYVFEPATRVLKMSDGKVSAGMVSDDIEHAQCADTLCVARITAERTARHFMMNRRASE